MIDKLKSPLLLLVVLILVSLSLAGGVFYLLQKERAKSASLQEELEDLKSRQRATEVKLDDAKKTIKDFDLKLSDAKAQIDKLTGDLQQEKSARQEALTQVDQLRSDLEQQKSLRADLEKKFTQAQQDVAKIQGQVKDLSSKKSELEKKIKALEAQVQPGPDQSVELGKVVVTPEGAQAPAVSSGAKPAEKESARPIVASSEGKVLVVNKDYNFAVINLGSKDGIVLGNVFGVYRDNKYLGDVKVEKVHDSMSAAGFVSADMQNKVSEGDRVVRKTKP